MKTIALAWFIVESLILGALLLVAHALMLPGRALLLVTRAAIDWMGRE